MQRVNVLTSAARALRLSAAAWLVLTSFTISLQAEPVGPDDARNAVTGWLVLQPKPFNASAELSIAGPVETVADASGGVLYHVVALSPGGFVIVGPDDRIEPIIAFAERGSYDEAPGRPLGDIAAADLSSRLAAVRALDAPPSAQLMSPADPDGLAQVAAEAQDRWARLLAACEPTASLMGLTNVSDVRVAPLVTSTWGQTTVGDYVGGLACYNFYTPPYSVGNNNNHPCGCLATAMAQIIRYYQYPATYVWSNMPLQPSTSTITDAQRIAIGELCYDTALSVNTVFRSISQGGSSADAADVPAGFKNRFGYGQAIVTNATPTDSLIKKTINCGLDAGMPVIVGLNGAVGAHGVVCDGYGYSGSTLYHHLNMGWSGGGNAWYAMPNVDSSPSFNQIIRIVYNIYPTGSGEIISGRATDAAGNGLPGVTVSSTVAGYGTFSDITDSHGVYALTQLPSNRSCTVVASRAPHSFANQNVTTGTSVTWGASGNVWGVNFASTSAAPPWAQGQSLAVQSGTTVDITLMAVDDGLPNPPGRLQYRIVTAPPHGRLIDPAAGEIVQLPHTLANNGNIVRYHACSYYSGADAFDFAADDGGVPVSGGQSDPATVSLDVQSTVTTTFAPQSGWVAKWPMRTSYHDSRTQVIYLSSEIGQAKNITDLALYVTTIPALPLTNWTIRMKHTSMSSYGALDGFQTTGWTTVYHGTVTVTNLGWWNLHLDTPFAYNGTSNLMIDFSHESSTWATPPGECAVSPMGVERVVLAYADSTHGDPRNWSEYYVPDEYYGSDGVPNIRLQSRVQGTPMAADFSVNCRIDMADLEMLAEAWLRTTGEAGWDPAVDISPVKDGRINHKDFAVFADKWLDVAN